MNALWISRWYRAKWFISLGPLREWRERRHARRLTLATPGVDKLVRDVMDARYGKYGWRVENGLLQAQVQEQGGRPWWGLIGPIRGAHTRRWLTDIWAELSHAKDAPDTIPFNQGERK